MPIRFRCAYCNQLMGISRRKAGTVVRCPSCSGQVVVPNPASEPTEKPHEAPSPKAGPQPQLFGGLSCPRPSICLVARPSRSGRRHVLPCASAGVAGSGIRTRFGRSALIGR